MIVKKILKDPLTHFMFGGVLIYCILSLGENSIQGDEIHISRQTLLEHIQFRSKIFDDEFAESKLSAMSAKQIQEMVAAIQTEEALYREAQSLGLEQGDYVIRQRLVGKMKYLTDGTEGASGANDVELEAYFKANASDYHLPAKLSFTHVFFDGKTTGSKIAGEKARQTLGILQREGVSAENAKTFGERFLFNDYYTGRTSSYLAQQFGEQMTTKLFSDEIPTETWSGPYESEYGSHLVYITERSSTREATFSEVRNQVNRDYTRNQRRVLEKAMQKSIVDSYRTTYSPDVSALLSSTP